MSAIPYKLQEGLWWTWPLNGFWLRSLACRSSSCVYDIYWFLELFLYSYIAFFAVSWGPVIWVITGEIFVSPSSIALRVLLIIPPQPLGIRAKSMSLAVASNWLWNFGIGYAIPYLVNPSTTGVNGEKAANLGVKVFFIWGATCVGCFIFT